MRMIFICYMCKDNFQFYGLSSCMMGIIKNRRNYRGTYKADNEQTRFNILFGDYDFIILQHVAHPMGEFSVMEEAADRIMES